MQCEFDPCERSVDMCAGAGTRWVLHLVNQPAIWTLLTNFSVRFIHTVLDIQSAFKGEDPLEVIVY